MKTNKLKVFFISCFIALLVALTAKTTPTITASAVSPPKEIFAPKNPPVEYNFEIYNHCGSSDNDLFICAFQNKYIQVVYSNNSGTFVSFFDKDLYKIKDIKILDSTCKDGVIYQNKIFLIDDSTFWVFDLEYNIINTLPFNNIQTIKVIDSTIYLFCNGDFGKNDFEYGIVINSLHNFVGKYASYFVFQSDTELLITDFDKKLIFEINSFVYAKASGLNIVFATIQNQETIITFINNFEIVYATSLPQVADNIDYNFEENGLSVFLTIDKTYRYFICNHGDIISNEIFSDTKYINVSENIYESDSYIFITINGVNYKIFNKIYQNRYCIIDNIIIFSYYDNLETYGAKDVYVAKFNQ